MVRRGVGIRQVKMGMRRRSRLLLRHSRINSHMAIMLWGDKCVAIWTSEVQIRQ